MEYTISKNLENSGVYAYAAKEFWVYDKQACRWYTSGFCREQHEQAKQKLSRLTPEDFLAYSNDYNLLDDYELPSEALDALQEAVKKRGKREADNRGIMTDAGELLPNGSECRRYALSCARLGMGKVQAIHVCDDQPDGVKIWLNAFCPAEYWVLCEAGEIESKHVESYPYCAAILKIGYGDVLLVPFGKELDSNKLPKIPEENNEPACSCAGCEREDCTCAGGRDAAGRADCAGAQNCTQSGCSYAVKHRANPTSLAAATAADKQTEDGPEQSDLAGMTAAPAAESNGPADLATSAAADADQPDDCINCQCRTCAESCDELDCENHRMRHKPPYLCHRSGETSCHEYVSSEKNSEMKADFPEVCRGCQCATCGNEDCPTPYFQKDDEVEEFKKLGPMGDDCEDYQPKEDAQCLKMSAPNGDAAASTGKNAAQEPQPEETMITQTSANSSSAPACPVDAGAATQSLSVANAASLAAESELDVATKRHSPEECQKCATPSDKCRCKECLREGCRDYPGTAYCVIGNNVCPGRVTEGTSISVSNGSTSFDYSSLDDQTVADLHLAEREYAGGKKMAEMGLRRMADAVAIAHDTLCGGCDNLSQAHNNQYSKDTFGAWCDSIGIHRKAAERLLQVSKLMANSTPREQKVLEELSPSLLYAAAKPSAPAELVQAVKDKDITTHKQFKELEAQIKAERQAREQAEQQLADAQREYQEERASTSALLRHEQQRRQEAEEGRMAAEKDKAAAQQKAREVQAQVKEGAALLDKLQGFLLQRDNEVAEQKERADAAELRAQKAQNRPVEVAVQAPTEEQINAAAKQRTAMLEAQLHTLQTQLDDAESRADAASNNAYMSAAEFAAQAAAMIDGIRASFWAMAKELPDADFNQALEPLDTAVSRIYNREWEDGWNDTWENNEEDNQQ